MNKIIKTILDEYGLKVNQRFKIINSECKGVYYFDEFGLLERETNNGGFENVSRAILGRLAHGVEIEKLDRYTESYNKTAYDLDYDDVYYWITSDGYICEDTFDSSGEKRRNCGTAFITKEEAERDLDRSKCEAILLKYGRRNFVNGKSNWYIQYFTREDLLQIYNTAFYQAQGVIWFDSMELAMKAVDEVGKEKVKKYLFGVKQDDQTK